MIHFFNDFDINFFIFSNKYNNAAKNIITYINFFIIIKTILHA